MGSLSHSVKSYIYVFSDVGGILCGCVFACLCVASRDCVFRGEVALCVCSADCTRPSVLLLFTMSVLIFVKWSLSLELSHTPYVVYPRSFVYVSSSHLLLPYLYFLYFELN